MRNLLLSVVVGLMPFAHAADWMSDTWVATDGLGRQLPLAAEVGAPRDRQVLMFYFLWAEANKPGPFDMSKALAADPELMSHPNSPLFGPPFAFHHWGEPLFGYYLADDRAVCRKHAQMLSDAGVDGIVFDVSNGPIYENGWRALLETFAEVEAAGGRAPKIAFLCPFSRTPSLRNSRGTVVRRLWQQLYKPGVHPELWYRHNGKPLILSYPAYADPSPVCFVDAIGDIVKDESVRKAVRLTPGHTLGARFTLTNSFAAISVSMPTWRAKTLCGATLSLRQEDPAGALVGTCRVSNISDNDAVRLELKREVPAGTYYLEVSDPVGTVGWWSRTSGVSRVCTAYADGKPVPGYRHLHVWADDEDARRIRDFFTFRAPTCGGYLKSVNLPGAWSWLENHPQDLHHAPDGSPEMMCVGVAQNSGFRGMQPMSQPGAMGRRWHDGANDPDPAMIAQGPNFQEQWRRALEVDPPLVFVTGWNEWIMQRIIDYHQWHHPCGNFVDQFNPEFSRDAEPMRGHFGDAYYWQLIQNVRRYKGVRAIPAVRSAAIAIDGRFDDWRTVAPEFLDTPGDPMRRDHPAWGRDGKRHVDHSGRNDIVMAKTCRANGEVCFLVRTRTPLTDPSGEDWMRLFIDVDRDAHTGWCGYDFMVAHENGKAVLRRHAGAATTVPNQLGGTFGWRAPLAEIRCAIAGDALELAIPEAAFGGALRPDGFDFKWADNCLQSLDWTDFTLHGDAAPNDRFNYRAIFP